MKKLSIFLIVFMLFLSPVTVYADDASPNAVNDILYGNDRYEGAIESIQFVTEFVDVFFSGFITLVAFLIISAAMLRNVLAGAYCAYPKFFDKVAEAHAEVATTGWVTRVLDLKNNYQNINMGSFGKAALRLVPNIKTLTDFEEENLEPKAYFIKAIPQMIMVIIIGVFIYNGYYRDTAAVVSNFGSEMFKRVIVSADPIAMFDRITGATGKPEFASDSSTEDMVQLQNKIAEKCYSKVISTYTDVKGSAAKSSIASQIDSWAGSQLAKCKEYSDNKESWAYSFDVIMTIGPTPQETGKVRLDQDNQRAVYVFDSLPISQLNLDTTKEVGVDWNLNVTVNFKKKAAKHTYVAATDLTFHLKGSFNEKKKGIKVPAPRGGDGKLVVSPFAEIAGYPVEYSEGYLRFKNKYPKDINNSDVEYDCSGIQYYDPSNRKHTITKIYHDPKSTFLKRQSTTTTYSYGQNIDLSQDTKKKKKK